MKIFEHIDENWTSQTDLLENWEKAELDAELSRAFDKQAIQWKWEDDEIFYKRDADLV